MYAYAHTPSTVKVITVTSIADFRNEISEKTPSGNGAVTDLAASLQGANGGARGERRSSFNFTWKPSKEVPASLFTALKADADFTLEIRLAETDAQNSPINRFDFNFYQCRLMKARRRSGGNVQVEASFGLFRKSPE